MEILNRQANHNYFILDTYEAGIELKGTEVKSIRQGACNIKDAYCLIKNNEVFVINMFVAKYKQGNIFNHDELRTRKLLLHKKEIKKINEKIKEKGLTLMPLKIYFKKGKAKMLIGVSKGKKNYDKRESIKEKDLQREKQKALKQYK